MRCLHLFNGIGGFALAADRMGWENVAHCEIDSFCNRIMKKHYPNSIKHEDIKTTDFRIYRGRIDLISGGFPCQDISIASRTSKGIDGEKSGLWRELVRAIAEVQPRYVVIENSTAILSRGFERLLFEVSQIGYNAEWHCLKGNQFGVPQRRKRLFLILYPAGYGNGMAKGQILTGWDKLEYTAWGHTRDRVYGVADDVPCRVDRHRALGNSVIVQIVYQIFRAIAANQLKSLNL